MEPMNLTCMLFSAIRKEMRRPASRRASLIRIKGSINCEVRNMDRGGDFLGGGSCLVGMRSGNEDDGSAAWDAVAASTANLAEKDIEHDCRHVSTGAGSEGEARGEKGGSGCVRARIHSRMSYTTDDDFVCGLVMCGGCSCGACACRLSSAAWFGGDDMLGGEGVCLWERASHGRPHLCWSCEASVHERKVGADSNHNRLRFVTLGPFTSSHSSAPPVRDGS
jgi:hypothetical protein